MNMVYSKTVVTLIEKFEDVKLKAYQDSVGVWTIGYGHTATVYPSMTITQSEAETLLYGDIQNAQRCVNSVVTVPLDQNEFDALVDFVFNLGCTALRGSTLLRAINLNSFTVAASEFEKWDHANGKVLNGLLTRRVAERDLFLEHDA